MGLDRTVTRRTVLRSAGAVGISALGLSTLGRAATTGDPPGSEPILLVHGYSDTDRSPWWDVLTDYLTDVGYANSDVYRINLGPLPGTTVDSPEEYAPAVKAKLRDLHDETGSPIDVIAHSMGGLDTRWALEKDDAAHLVDDLVTLGTPHQGTYAAYLGLTTHGGRDMRPDSEFVRSLNDGQLAEGVEYTAVWSHADELIDPSPYAELPEPELDSVSVARNVDSGYQEHVELVYDRHVFDQYYRFLD